MSNIGNKETMSKNLKYYIEQSGKDRKELAKIWGFPYSTVTEWINGKKYPRIDRIEKMADYFGIKKSDLIEEKLNDDDKKKNDTATGIVIRLGNDEEFCDLVKMLYKMDSKQIASIKAMLTSFIK